MTQPQQENLGSQVVEQCQAEVRNAQGTTCTGMQNEAVQSLFEEFNLDDIEVIESKVFA